MVLDEQLRERLDLVAHRLKQVDTIAVAASLSVAVALAYCISRIVTGILSGGDGFGVAVAISVAVGLTMILTHPRKEHNRLTAARFVDQGLDLQDRLATAVEHASLDALPRSKVEGWLLDDAAARTDLINPQELVRYRLPRRTRWLIPLLPLCLLLSLPIYPRGLTWQLGSAKVRQAAQRADELLALAEQLDLLASEQPEMRQLAHDLRTLGEMLRDKQLPQNEAQWLLRELAQELTGSSTMSPGLDLDVARIQSLAQQLGNLDQSRGRGDSSQTSGSGQTGSNQGPGRANSQHGTPGNGNSAPKTEQNGLSDATRNSSGSQQEHGSDQEGKRSAGTSQDGDSARSDAGQRTPSPGATPGNEDGGDEYGTDTQPSGIGTQKGSQMRLDSYQSSDDLGRESLALSGQLSESGEWLTRPVQGIISSIPVDQKRAFGWSPPSTPAAVEQAIQQENIPLAYRQWIRRYFQELEPR